MCSIMPPVKVVLLACGSFNPPTNMHFRLFEVAKDHLQRLGQCLVIGGVISPVHDNYGKKELVSSSHRCAMIRLGIENSSWLHLSDWECNQADWSPTVQVLRYHQNQINNMIRSNNSESQKKRARQEVSVSWLQGMDIDEPDSTQYTSVQVKLLCGADFLESFGKPGLWAEKDIEAIVGEHGLVVISRVGSDPSKFIYESDLLTKHSANITLVTEWITNEISSTKIRRAFRRGESVKYLMSESVEQYVRNHGLYSATSKYQPVVGVVDSNEIVLSLLSSSASVPKLVISEPDHYSSPGKKSKKSKTNRKAKKVKFENLKRRGVS